MAAISNDNWMTSFFYAQDLRSLYMNGLLNAGFKPGIYNAGAYVYAVDSNNSNLDPGLYLRIKKGTTFIFSNGYKKSNTGIYERDLSIPGDFLIKSFALKDVNIPLAKLSKDTSSDVFEILGNSLKSISAAPYIYIIACISYDGDRDVGSTYGNYPQFKIAINNPSNSTGNYYFKVPLEDSDKFPFFDGGSQDPSSVDTFKNISYLTLGALQDISSPTSSYLQGESSWDSNGASNFIKNHIFTMKGLPEYRHDIIFNKNTESPDLLINVAKDNNYLSIDIPSTFIEDEIIKEEVDWKSIYEIEGFSLDETSKIELPKEDNTSSLDINDNYYSLDLLFLSKRFKYSGNTNYSEIYKSSDEIKLKSYRAYIPCRNLKATLGDSYSGNMIPLDINEDHLDRLLPLIENHSIVPYIINEMRRENKIESSEGTSLIPIGIYFRKLEYDTSNNTWICKDTISSSANVSTSIGKINPCNILSFLDLQFKTNKINTISFNSKDIFSVLPTLE